MTRTNTLQSLALMLGAALNHGSALAHEGHGLPGSSHWHGTDLFGFIAIGLLVAGAIWMRGRK